MYGSSYGMNSEQQQQYVPPESRATTVLRDAVRVNEESQLIGQNTMSQMVGQREQLESSHRQVEETRSLTQGQGLQSGELKDIAVSISVRVVFFLRGTRGDVQPFVALARGMATHVKGKGAVVRDGLTRKAAAEKKVSKDEEEARTVQRDLRDPAAQRDLLRADSRGEEEEETATDESAARMGCLRQQERKYFEGLFVSLRNYSV